MRSDLAVSRHDSGGWVVKDPIGLNYALLDDAEYTILRLLDGRISLSAMMDNLRQRFPSKQLSADDLADFIRVLAGQQLIRQTAAGDHRRLHTLKNLGMLGWVLQFLTNILRLQISLFNPTRFITATLPFVRLAYRPKAIAFAAIVCAIALAIVMLRFGELQRAVSDIAQFLSAQNVILMLTIFVVVKVLHEAGHAFTARYFGAECNECGIMLLVLTPVLYTNVTDAWTLGRRQRMLVTAAGIMVELFIAAVCTVLWWMATDGLVRSILLNTMLLCSLNTLLFNGNPLLRFDGYFLLADWVGIPNLAARASGIVQRFFLQLVTGVVVPCHEPDRQRKFLLGYGLIAMAYRIVLTLAILQLIQFVSRQWRLEIAGNVVSMVLITGSVVMPLMSFFAMVTAGDNVGRYKAGAFFRMAIAAALMLLAVLYPFPESVVAPAIVKPDSMPLYAPLAGRSQPAVAYGETVTKHQVLAELTSVSLQRTLQSYASRTDDLKTQLQVLQRNAVTANSELIPSLKQSLQAAEEQQASFQAELQKLTITSQQEGRLFPPPNVERVTRTDLPKLWSGTPLEQKNTNAFIERGTLLGYVGDEWEVKLLACVTEKQIEGLLPDQTVLFRCQCGEAVDIAGRVTEVSRVPIEGLPKALSVSGLVAGEATASGLKPAETSFYVVVALDANQQSIPPALYSVGHVRIGVKKSSMLQRFTRFLRQTF